MVAEFSLVFALLSLLSCAAQDGSRVAQGQPNAAEALVQQLGSFPASLGPPVRSDGRPVPIEERRRQLYGQIRALGKEALPALARGLSDDDVQVRRNVALFLGVAAGSWYAPAEARLDIAPMLTALITGLRDSDASVRARAAQAIGEIGPRAVAAVPALVVLLGNPDEGSRCGACIGLTGIGPAAKEALPALERALSDPSADVRRFAQRAIGRIDVR